jgi:hypothetical protein
MVVWAQLGATWTTERAPRARMLNIARDRQLRQGLYPPRAETSSWVSKKRRPLASLPSSCLPRSANQAWPAVSLVTKAYSVCSDTRETLWSVAAGTARALPEAGVWRGRSLEDSPDGAPSLRCMHGSSWVRTTGRSRCRMLCDGPPTTGDAGGSPFRQGGEHCRRARRFWWVSRQELRRPSSRSRSRTRSKATFAILSQTANLESRARKTRRNIFYIVWGDRG